MGDGRRPHTAPAHLAAVTRWRELYRAGEAGRVADATVRAHHALVGIPDTLVDAIAKDPPTALSTRELEVILLAAEGLSVKETALRLGISRWTVKGYRHAAFCKLNARNVAQAVALLAVAPRLTLTAWCSTFVLPWRAS